MTLEIVILAAGKGTRMRSERPKVLHELGGVPLVQHVLDTARSLAPDKIHVVYGHGGDRLRGLAGTEDVHWVLQAEQLGTGHAVKMAMATVADAARVLVLYGDVPLIRPETLARMLNCSDDRSALALLTVNLDRPQGYGRILRDGAKRIVGIVEERDATAAEKEIAEVNTGVVSVSAGRLKTWLNRLQADNAQGEYYLTDVISLAVADAAVVVDCQAEHSFEVLGVNSRSDLARLERLYQRQRAETFMDQGVTMLDPDRFDARGPIAIGADSVVDVNVVLEGPLQIGPRCRIGPNTIISRARVDADVVVHANCVIDQAEIGRGAQIGPFARVRPGTRLGAEVHVGNFVEIKNSSLEAGTKANHLSYIGDSSLGRGVNVGAGVITCNYDGANKHHTDIGDDVFVGSNSQLVAPVSIGDGATIGAGSTITENVPEGVLALTRSAQRVITGWRRPRKKSKIGP